MSIPTCHEGVAGNVPVPCRRWGHTTHSLADSHGTANSTPTRAPAAAALLRRPPSVSAQPAREREGSGGTPADTYLPARPRAARRTAWPGQGVSAGCCRAHERLP